MNLFSAFLESLYSLSFYRKAARASLSRGFQYLALWSAVASVIIMLFVFFRLYPMAKEFSVWFKGAMPIVTWTPEGVTIDKPSPYEMRHPKFGHVITFDTNRKDITSEDMGDALFFLTSTKLYTKQPQRGELRVYDLIPRSDVKPTQQKFVLDQRVVTSFEAKLKPIALIGAGIFTFIIFFIWKLLAALFYSLIGALFNKTRQEKLSYESVLNVTFFAMTAAHWINFILFFLSDMIRIPFGFFGSLAVTALYLYLGVKASENTEPSVNG